MGIDLIALVAFAASMSLTPGPNNVLLTAAGANFGLRASMPQILGITFGFPVMIAAVGLGAAGILASIPSLHHALKIVGSAYLVWLAWRMAAAPAQAREAAQRARPMTAFEAALFQWINPKAWIIIASALPTFTTVGGDMLREVALIAVIFAAVCMPSCTIWCAFGVAIGRWLGSASAFRTFNISMAALLLASIGTIWI